MNLEIRVFYVGRGSAVVIKFGGPNGRSVGIVDCYRGPFDGPTLADFLLANEIDTVEFLILTHPHEDHFLGVGAILEKFDGKIKKYLDWGISPREIVVTAFQDQAGGVARAELIALERFCKGKKNQSKIGSISSPGLMIYDDEQAGIRVRSVAPLGSVYRKVQESVSRYFRSCLKAFVVSQSKGEEIVLPRPVAGMDLNKLSSAILVESPYGSVLLGGDVLARDWEILLESNSLPVDVVLLSHHGSYTGFPKNRWATGAFGHRQTIALVSGEGRHQPSSQVEDHLKVYGNELVCTSRGMTRPGQSSLREYVNRMHLGRPWGESSGADIVVTLAKTGIEVKREPPKLFDLGFRALHG